MNLIIHFCVLILAISSTASADCECGLEGSGSRIYKGRVVKPHKYPWLAHLRSWKDRSGRSFSLCGGSLVDDRTIITAAHCVVDDSGSTFSPSQIDVYLGRVNALSERSTPEQVARIWVDPSYNRQDLSNDFAILTLARPVRFTQTVSPVCLPNSENGISDLKVAGWGTTSSTASASDDLLEVDVKLIDRQRCNKMKYEHVLKQNGIVPRPNVIYQVPPVAESHLCALNEQTLGDACEGDSGGPIMQKSSDGRWYLMGVVSGAWGQCGQDKSTPGLYTRTTYYADRIKSISSGSCWRDIFPGSNSGSASIPISRPSPPSSNNPGTGSRPGPSNRPSPPSRPGPSSKQPSSFKPGSSSGSSNEIMIVAPGSSDPVSLSEFLNEMFNGNSPSGTPAISGTYRLPGSSSSSWSSGYGRRPASILSGFRPIFG